MEPKATTEEIKKAFRRLAHEFHPDKNQENPFAQARFISIQEAYTILTHVEKRANYDHERWLSGRFNKKTTILTPEFINIEIIKLKEHLATLDVYRMNKQLLHEYLLFLLSDEKLAILNLKSDENTTNAITNNIIGITELLPVYFALPVLQKLRLLAMTKPFVSDAINTQYQRRIKEQKLQKMQPWFVVFIVITLLTTMYLYSKR